MGKARLIIDNRIADVYSESDLLTTVTFAVSTVSNIDGANNPTTKTIKLPGTAKNRKIFGFADDVNVTDFNGQKKSLMGKIVESGNVILEGVVNLKAVTRNENEITFECTIIGNCGQWIELLKSAQLKGMDLEGEHQKTKDYIDANVTTNPVIYALVNNGFPGVQLEVEAVEDAGGNDIGLAKFLLTGTSSIRGLRADTYGESMFNVHDKLTGTTFDVSAYNSIHTVRSFGIDDEGRTYIVVNSDYRGDATGILREQKCHVAVENMSMVINIRLVLKRMFQLAGYVLQSDFIESDYFKSLYLLPGRERRSEAFVKDNYTEVKVATTLTYNAGNISEVVPIPFAAATTNTAGLFNLSTYRFTASEAMLVLFTASVNIKGEEGYRAYVTFHVYDENNNILHGGHNRVINKIELKEDEYQAISQEAEIRLQEGDYVVAKLNVPVMYPSGADPCDWFEISVDESWLKCEVQDNVIKGTSVVPSEYLPDITQLEFVTAIRQLFNLYFLTDIAMKRVYVEPRDSFFKQDKFIDLTQKLDISKAIVFEELGADLNKIIKYCYKQDSQDEGVNIAEKLSGIRYSAYLADNLNKFSGKGETLVENNLFAPTLMDKFTSIGLTTHFPKIWQAIENNDTYPAMLDDFTPRILHYDGVKNCKSGETWYWENTEVDQFAWVYFHDYNSGNSNSLLFGGTSINPDLFNRYWKNHVKTINEARKITAFFKLTPNDIQSLMTPDILGDSVKDFRSKVYFRLGSEVSHCRLDSVQDYAPGANKTTKVVLVTDVDETFVQTVIPNTITEKVFTNILQSGEHANGTIYLISNQWSRAHDAVSGQGISRALDHGVGATGSPDAKTPYMIERLFMYFNTVDIPDDAVILEAYLDIYKVYGDSTQEITVFEGTQGDILTTSHYQSFGAVAFGHSSPGGYGYRRIALNPAGVANINKSGWSKFALRESTYDVQNIPTTQDYNTFRTYHNVAPIGQKNKLTVIYQE